MLKNSCNEACNSKLVYLGSFVKNENLEIFYSQNLIAESMDLSVFHLVEFQLFDWILYRIFVQESN